MIHIAGTNGKTSTARMAAALIGAHGLTPGLFTSPHLDAVEQRFEVGGFPMTPAEFAEAMGELAPIVDLYEERTGDPVTYFELTTALALAWFAERTVDVGVVEVGLGGRLDATNVVDAEVAVVTSIGLDHTEYLGDTIPQIAVEKLAILKKGAVLVTGDLDPAATAVAGERVAEQQARWFRHGTDFAVAEVARQAGGWVFDVEGVYRRYSELGLRLHGRHQVANFATAVAAAEALFGRGLDEAAVRESAATVTSPGRMEVAGDDPLVLVDGAHNPSGIAALAAALREEYPAIRWTLVFGAMGDKDVPGMVDGLDGLVGSVFTAAARTPRAMPADEVATVVGQRLGIGVEPHASVAAALGAALADGGPVLVTGSIYVVGEARRALGLS